MCNHFHIVCSKCAATIRQCRCTGKKKTTYQICPACQAELAGKVGPKQTSGSFVERMRAITKRAQTEGLRWQIADQRKALNDLIYSQALSGKYSFQSLDMLYPENKAWFEEEGFVVEDNNISWE